MKKIVTMAALALFMVSVQGTALGVGGAFNLGIGSTVNPGGALTVKLDKSPWVFGASASGTSTSLRVGLTADYWMTSGNLVDFLQYYIGPGAYSGMQLGSNSALDIGLRVPFGINAFLLNNSLELFLEVAPTAGIGMNPFQFPTWGVQSAFGFRFWFK